MPETSTAELDFIRRKADSLQLYCNRHVGFNPLSYGQDNDQKGDLYLQPKLKSRDEKRVTLLKFASAKAVWAYLAEVEKQNRSK